MSCVVRSSLSSVAAAAALLLLGAAPAVAAQGKPVTLLNVSYDPTRELYQDDQRRVRQGSGRPRPGRTSRSTSRTAARASRRARSSTASRPTSSRWRSPTTSTRWSTPGKLIPGQLADAAAQRQHAVHLDDRVPGAQGQPEADQGLGRPGAARRLGDHAEPEDLGRRALELPGGVGLRPARRSAATRPRRRTSSSGSTRTCRCSTPAPAARRRRSCSAASATC